MSCSEELWVPGVSAPVSAAGTRQPRSRAALARAAGRAACRRPEHGPRREGPRGTHIGKVTRVIPVAGHRPFGTGTRTSPRASRGWQGTAQSMRAQRSSLDACTMVTVLCPVTPMSMVYTPSMM